MNPPTGNNPNISRQACVWASMRWGLGGVLLLAALVFYFSKVHGPDDPWTTGHMLLLAKSYLQANFQTPAFSPMEDPYGPVAGWSPYTGQLPLPPIIWALFMRFTGVTWEAAHGLACLFTAVTALLTFSLAWRITRNMAVSLFALAVFCGNALIILYASFAWHDTLALPWVLLLILLFPSWVANGTPRLWMAYLVLAVLGGLIGWWCYLVPMVCGAALALANRSLLRKCWHRLILLLTLLVITGALALAVYGGLEKGNHPNGWLNAPQGSDVLGKLLTRTGLNNPLHAPRQWMLWVLNIVQSVGPFAAAAALVVVIQCRQAQPQTKPSLALAWPDSNSAFYFHALWLYPLFWAALMSGGMGHSFAAIHSVPFLAIFLAAAVYFTAGAFVHHPWRQGLLIAACCLLAAPSVLIAIHNSGKGRGPYWGSGKYPHHEVYATLEQDLQRLTAPGTIVVMGFDERGLWWSTKRPVVSLTRLSSVVSTQHVLVLPVGDLTQWTEKYRPLWEGKYRPLVERMLPLYSYVIMAPSSSASGQPALP